MKRTLLFSIFLLLLVIVKGQGLTGNSVTGTITDSTSHLPLEYATITLFTKGSNKPVTGSVTDKKGNFTINEIKDGVYTIVFEFIGYKPVSLKEVGLNKSNPLLNVKNNALAQQKETLQSVPVVAQSKLIENKIDKMVFNAEKDLTSQSGVATDVLKAMQR